MRSVRFPFPGTARDSAGKGPSSGEKPSTSTLKLSLSASSPGANRWSASAAALARVGPSGRVGKPMLALRSTSTATRFFTRTWASCRRPGSSRKKRAIAPARRRSTRRTRRRKVDGSRDNPTTASTTPSRTSRASPTSAQSGNGDRLTRRQVVVVPPLISAS